MRERAQEWLCKEMRKARVALGHAESRPGVTDEELTNLSNKIAAIDWLLEMMGCSSGSRWISVEVVRCRNCKYWSGRNDKPHEVTAIGYCHHRNHLIMPIPASWYCADGKRRMKEECE